MAKQTPMIKQYREVKSQHPDAILFFRLGDFYEMFFDDAKIASEVLGLTLTSRGKDGGEPIPLAGIPWHKADHYIDRLLRAGHRVAVCNQTEDPKKAKGLIRREVTEVVTPGTAISGSTIDSKRPNYLISLHLNGKTAGLAAIDVTTGDFRIGEFAMSDLAEEISRFAPAEVLMPDSCGSQIELFDRLERTPAVTSLEDWRFDGEEGERLLKAHFGVETLDGFGCSSLRLGLSAAGVLFSYLRDLGRGDLKHVDRISLIDMASHLVIDEATRRNLELFRPIREGPIDTTLLSIVDETVTAMGGRLLREWMMRPLRSPLDIEERLGAVDEGVRRTSLRSDTRALLASLADLERLSGRLALGRGSPRDLAALATTLETLPGLRRRLGECESNLFRELGDQIEEKNELASLIRRAIVDEPPATARDGGLIREGYHKELDELRVVGASGQNWITSFQQREREKTGISTLKVGFNRVFGFYIEVSKIKSGAVPPNYVRKQTLVAAERYITPELKEQEDQILGAEEKIKSLEEELFLDVRQTAASEGISLRRTAKGIAVVDSLLSFSVTAVRRNYRRPHVNDGTTLRITQGRHAVVEAILPSGKFIPNDTLLDTGESQIHIITGPNMAGKSTYLRQVALIQILAQMGSWVPAESAELGAADRIFTRVGASDDLARGQSTFLVEMTETANILNNASPRSLILLDEIGRGTSTFDGVSIAWAVVEYLHENQRVAAKTLFATHYHELADLADRLVRVKNFSVLVKEWSNRVVFLRQIAPGSVDRSYGIQVARLAGLPDEVIGRATEVLQHLEKEHGTAPARIKSDNSPQIDLFRGGRELLLDDLRGVDTDRMTPLDGLQKLKELRDRLIDSEGGE